MSGVVYLNKEKMFWGFSLASATCASIVGRDCLRYIHFGVYAVSAVSIYGSPRRCGGQGDILSGRYVKNRMKQ